MPKANADSVSDATPLDAPIVRRADGTLTEVVIPSDERAVDVVAGDAPRKRDEPSNRNPETGDIEVKGPDEPDHGPDTAYGVGTEPAARTNSPASVHAAPDTSRPADRDERTSSDTSQDSQGGERSSDGSNSRTSTLKTGSTPARQKRTGNGR